MQAPPPPRWRRAAERSRSPQRRVSPPPPARSLGCGERALAGAAQDGCEAAASPAFKPGSHTVERISALLAKHAAERAAFEDAADAWLNGALPLSPPDTSSQQLSAPRTFARTPLAPLNTLLGAHDSPAKPGQVMLPTPLRDALPTPSAAAFTFASPPAAPLRMPAVFAVWQDTDEADDSSADEARADAFAAKRRARTALRALACAVQQTHAQLEVAQHAHRERVVAKALHGWRAVLACTRRRTSLTLVSELRGAATRVRAAFGAWASVTRRTALLRDQHGAAAAIARRRQLAHALSAWRAAAACRAPRLLALRPLLAGWRTAAKLSVAASRTLHASIRRRRCFLAWAAWARSCGGVGARKARAHAALAAFRELRQHLQAVQAAAAVAGAPPAVPLMPAAVANALAKIAQRPDIVV